MSSFFSRTWLQGLAVSRRALLAFGVLIVGSALILRDLWPLLHEQWTEINNYNHGYLLLLLAAWLFVRDWRRQPPVVIRPEPVFVWAVLASVAVMMAMELLYLNAPRLFVLPLLFIAVTGMVFGREVMRHATPPLLLLYFALPLWGMANGFLQSLTTVVAVAALRLTDITAFIEGNFVHLPAGIFEIAEGCSGLNYLIVGMSLTAFYGLAYLQSWTMRALLFAIAVAVTLFANWLRVYIIVVVGYVTDMQHYLVAVDHVTFGWVLFAVMLVPVLWVARRLELRELAAAGTSARRLPSSASGQEKSSAVGGRPAVAALLAVALIAAPGLVNRVGAGDALTDRVSSLPRALPDGSAASSGRSSWTPVFDGGHVEIVRYEFHGADVDVFRALYPVQSRDARLVRYHHSFEGTQWRRVNRAQRDTILGSDAIALVEYEGYANGESRLVWAWYEVAGRVASSEVEVKMHELRGLLDGRRDGAAIAVSLPCQADCRLARQQLEQFMRANGQALRWTEPGRTTG